MNIISITQVKNEMDIVESFVRYHLNIFDGMIIYDDNSTDETLNILNLLKKEELPILIVPGKYKEYNQVKTVNNLLKIAIEKYNADLVIPLDVDEFLVCDDENPRQILEMMHKDDTYYSSLWRTYLPIYDEDTSEFSISNLNYIRDENVETLSKIMVPSKLYKKYDVIIKKGSHDLDYDKQYKGSIINKHCEKLHIAHFPVRNKEQAISKIIVGALNNYTVYDRKPLNSWHKKELSELIVSKNGVISDEDLVDIAKKYSSRKAEFSEVDIVKCPFNISFCKNLEIKYKNNNIKYFKDIVENSENIALNYARLRQELDYINDDILEDAKQNSKINYKYLELLEESYQKIKNKLNAQEIKLERISINNDTLRRRIRKSNEERNKLRKKHEEISTRYLDQKSYLEKQRSDLYKAIEDKGKAYQEINNLKQRLKTESDKNKKLKQDVSNITKNYRDSEKEREKLKGIIEANNKNSIQ